MLPTSQTKTYTVRLNNDGRQIEVKANNIYTEHNVSAYGMPSQTFNFFQPKWLKKGQIVMLLVNKEYKKGFLSLKEDNLWEFVIRDHNGKITAFYDL